MSVKYQSIISSPQRVEAPFIYVKIGEYTFGVYDKTGDKSKGLTKVYPNYIQSMTVKKINGQVNQYSLVLKYAVQFGDDPNMFEKIFSTIKGTRTITIDYGDFTLPEYIYKSEEAIITNINTDFDMQSNVFTYTIEATSTYISASVASFSFAATKGKPSDIILRVIKDKQYGLQTIFKGMTEDNIEKYGLIDQSDRGNMSIPYFQGSPIEYISKLVSYMWPLSESEGRERPTRSQIYHNPVYSLTTYEGTGDITGPYFRVQKISSSQNSLNRLCTYEVDVGYPSANIITSFKVNNQANWSLYYDYNREVSTSNNITKINNKGEAEEVYSPLLPGVNFILTEEDKSWWSKVTQYPITATITMKGLLKPAILMTYLKVNVWCYGHKHNSSGYYIITSQEDSISGNGIITTLGLTRVAEDEELM